MGIACVAYESDAHAVEHLKSLISAGASGYTVAINAEKIVRCEKDADFRELVRHALIKVPDGAGAVLALRVLHSVRSAKVDFPQAALRAAADLGSACRLAVIGATEQSHLGAIAEIQRRFPAVQLVMHRSGYTPQEALLAELATTRPQLCLVAMGTPKQENFAMQAVGSGLACIFVGCGGALDIMSGHAVRAPTWMVNNYLEWAYRLWQQPARWRRQLVLPVFLFKLMLAWAARR